MNFPPLESVTRRFRDPLLLSALLVTLLLPGCTITQEQLDQYSIEHSHALSRVSYSGELSNTDGSVPFSGLMKSVWKSPNSTTAPVCL